MQTWQRLLNNSLRRPEELAGHFDIDSGLLAGMAAVAERYPMRINPYYLGLIRRPGDPLWKQAVPDLRELEDKVCPADPLDEENLSPVANLVHKYPDRALFLVTSQCAMYCRFCTRKRKVGTGEMRVNRESIAAGLDYLRRTPAIRDVLVSGGDPLLLPDAELEAILAALRAIPSIEIIRIGSRVPCTLPMRVTVRLAAMLRKFHPLYINTHFNHPDEITPASALACGRLADAGIPLGCQTVLLRGVNDDPVVLKRLMHGLLRLRVKPYYLFQADMTRGTDHFRTPIRQGMEIMRTLIGHTSGLAVPTFALDLPGGGGKVPLTPSYGGNPGAPLTFTNYCGSVYSYRNPE